jgi:hypothetical protein
MGKTLIRRCLRLYVRSAVRLALRLFAPRGGFLPATEPVLDGFSILRGTVGLLVLVIIDTAYSADLGGFQDFPLTPPSLADSWVLIGAPGVIVLLALTALCFTRRGHRRRAARQLLHPVQAVITFLLLAAALSWGAPLLGDAADHGLTAQLALDLLSALAPLWCLIFMGCALWCCAAGPFRAGDGHPLLAPAATTAFAWLAAVHALTTGGPPAAMPRAVYFAVILGGPATVTAVSGLEIWLLRGRYPGQFPFREGPLTAHPQPAALWSDVHLVAFLGQQLAEFGQQLKELGQRLARIG